MKVVVTGAAGQLGAVVVRRISSEGHGVHGLTRRELDITRHADVVRLIGELRPDVVVNCAAYNDVDAAEDHQVEALAANAFAVRSLARAARAVEAALVHYSTDFVFDGGATAPYTEQDAPNPQSVYAASKLLGEWFATDVPRHYVLRVESLFGGPAARSSIDRLLAALEAGTEARAFVDRVVSPSYVEHVAAATQHLLECGAPPGLYHCVNSGHATWHELGQAIAGRIGASGSLLVPISTADLPLRARRPRYAALSSAKLAGTGFRMPEWRDAIATYLASRRAAR